MHVPEPPDRLWCSSEKSAKSPPRPPRVARRHLGTIVDDLEARANVSVSPTRLAVRRLLARAGVDGADEADVQAAPIDHDW